MPVSSPQCNKIVGHFSERLKMYQNHRKFSHLEIEVKNEDSEAEDGKIVEKLEIFSPIQNGNEFYGFSISSSPIFLYKIAKYSAKFNVNLIDGLWAIGDYVTLLKFEKNVQKRAVDTYKGLYLKCLLLFKNNQKSASFDLITQISPDLFRLNLKSKLKDLHHFLENN